MTITFASYYDQDISLDLVKQLAVIEVEAIWGRSLQEDHASIEVDLELTQAQLQDFFERNPDYTLTVAYEDGRAIGFVAGSEMPDDDRFHVIESFYTLPSKNLGKQIMEEFFDNLPSSVEILTARPLEGSEQVWRQKLGFKPMENGSSMVMKNI